MFVPNGKKRSSGLRNAAVLVFPLQAFRQGGPQNKDSIESYWYFEHDILLTHSLFCTFIVVNTVLGRRRKQILDTTLSFLCSYPVGVIGQKVTEFEKPVDFDGAKRTTAISEIKEVCLFPVQNMRAGWNKWSCIFKYRSLQNSDTPVFDFFPILKEQSSLHVMRHFGRGWPSGNPARNSNA